ncbi:hypothetical protein I553_3560 [Mycobacterium xenopi 4042]|uniref:Uncharacterized protein n=1 Tax=Mycobacterium xenopi 4042 TaxID=1299334 RepID=X8AN34_MYCXE|nr:hypothetical protein I553_3560 [Mycobacterium xenopi 4042]
MDHPAQAGWVMLNSSDANEHRDDPPCGEPSVSPRRGYGGIDIANLYGFVSKTPAALHDQDDRSGLTTMRTLPRFAPTMTSP